ncbi:MAG: sugar transferase [Microcystis aeruginosa G13-05]|jgi:lipopolysaccharide/colanic/teichoic acid biosynthesis glycosyltransferase|nr:sugar transferase [Microcystis aeruginosa BK11-02]NCS51688.1 sugar transferase [Microcystis aeruginosa G13-05]
MCYQKRKNYLDLVVASFLLLCTLPIMLLIAVAIKLDSPGPILFRQQRVGKHGKPFTLLKFRSMYDGADSEPHRRYATRLIRENVRPLIDSPRASLKLTNDTRITRVGRFLRSASLDELPQLINVLRGEMSLVGPRPPLPYEVAVYQERHKPRLNIKPGITGLWQVEGRNLVSFEEMVRMDLQYIKTMNFWLDISILLRTPREMIRGKGAG